MKKVLALVVLATMAGIASATTVGNLRLNAQSGTSATITWTTNVPASTQLWYGVGVPSNQTPRDPTLVTSHSVTLTGVSNNSTYLYYAISVDGSNNMATSATQTFTVCTGAGPNNGLTNVQGTVNNYYEYGDYAFVWQAPAGFVGTPTLCGNGLTTTYLGNLDGGASVSRQIPDTTQIVPSPSQWRVTVTGIDGMIGSFQITQAITPKGNNLSAALQAAAAGNLIHVWYDPNTGTFYPPGGGGGGTISGSGTANFLPIWTDTTVLGNSPIYTDATGLASLTVPFTGAINLNAPQVNINGAAGVAGAITLAQGTAAGTSANSVTLEAPASVATGYAINLPAAQGVGALVDDGSGNTAWSPVLNGLPDYNFWKNGQNVQELDGVYYPAGAIAFGNSICLGFGLPQGMGWASIIQTNLNILNGISSYNNFPTCVVGNTSADDSMTAWGAVTPTESGNPAQVVQDSTNNISGETNVTPPAAHKVAFTAQMGAVAARLASAASANFRPAAQPIAMTGQTVTVANNVATVPLTNGFAVGERLIVTGCANTALNSGAGVVVTNDTTLQFSFAFANGFVSTSYTGETCSFTTSNPWTEATGTWNDLSSVAASNYVAGPSQGIAYQIGNLVTQSCSIRNQIYQLTNVSSTFDTGLRMTTTTSGGAIVSAVVTTPATNVNMVDQSYFLFAGGDGTAIGQVHNLVVNGIPTFITGTVTVVFGGSSGYADSTGVVGNTQGLLVYQGVKVIQVGAGCTQSAGASIATTCAVGSASTCGQGGSFSNLNGPFFLSTASASATLTSTINVGAGGDVFLIYPVSATSGVGSGHYGGTISVLDGATVLRDTFYTGLTAIPENFAGTDSWPYGPTNFLMGDAIQVAHFNVTPNSSHVFTIQCVNAGGSTCAVGSFIVPSTNHQVTVNGPNAFVGGALPIGNNSGPTCGLTGQWCNSLYSTWIQGMTADLGSAGLPVVYKSMDNLDPVKDFYNTSGTFANSVEDGCVTNDAITQLHPDSCGEQKIAQNFLSGMRVIPGLSNSLNITGGRLTLQGTANGPWAEYAYTTQSIGLKQQVSAHVGPILTNTSMSWMPCSYTFSSGADPFNNLAGCLGYFEIFNKTMRLLEGATATGTTNQISSTLQIFNSMVNPGIYIVPPTATTGSGYTGTPVVTASGGTCTILPTFKASLISTAVNVLIVNIGNCTVLPSVALTGVSGGTGFGLIIDLGNGINLTQTSIGSGFSGSGTVSPTGGTCAVAPTLNSALSGSGIAVTIATEGSCSVPPTGIAVSGYTGGTTQPTVIFAQNSPTGDQEWQIDGGFSGNPSSAMLMLKQISDCQSTAQCGVAMQSKSLGGFNFLFSNTNNQPVTFRDNNVTSGTAPVIDFLNGVSGTLALYASTTPVASAATAGTDANGRIVAGIHSSGAGAPAGNCTVGSIYSNLTASTASTVLYVCAPANTWTAVTVP